MDRPVLPLRRRMAAWATTLLVAVGVVAAAPGTALAGPNEGDFFGAVNSARASSGVPALDWAEDLAAVARRQAERMAASGNLEHNPNLGSEVSNWRIVSENIGYGPTWSSIEQAFMASSEHRANLLDPQVTQLGVGTAVGKDGTLWVSQVFRLPYGANPPSGGGSSAGTGPSSSSEAPVQVVTTPVPPPPSPEDLLRDRIRTARDHLEHRKHRATDPLSEALDYTAVMATVAR